MATIDDSIKSLQDNLSMLRKLYGWTMEQLGNRLGVTKQTISNLEHGSPRMSKIQYIAIRAIFETEANERSSEEKDNLLKVISLICDLDTDVSDSQRKEAIEAAQIVAGATASGVNTSSTMKLLTTALASVGVFVALPSAIPIVTGMATGSWIVKLLNEKNNAEKEMDKK